MPSRQPQSNKSRSSGPQRSKKRVVPVSESDDEELMSIDGEKSDEERILDDDDDFDNMPTPPVPGSSKETVSKPGRSESHRRSAPKRVKTNEEGLTPPPQRINKSRSRAPQVASDNRRSSQEVSNPPARSVAGTSLPKRNDEVIENCSSPVRSESLLEDSADERVENEERSGDNEASAVPLHEGVENYDKNDDQWNQFSQTVEQSADTAHVYLATILTNAGTNCTALLGKFIYRCVSQQDSETQIVSRLNEKCAFTIIRSVLHLTNHADTASSGIVIDLVSMMFTELRHFSTGVLYGIVNNCLEYMKEDRDGSLPVRWIEVFGKIVSVMMGRGDIKHETDILDGKSYRQYLINAICRVKWTTENTASLIAVLREIPALEDNDFYMIFNQIRTSSKNIKSSAFPPIVHQLILLAGSRCPSALLSICADYFKPVNFSETSLEVRQKRNALGTVVFHFVEAARHCSTLIKAVLKVIKASLFDFGHVMSPFMICVALGLTTFGHAKEQIIDPLRNSIMKSYHSMHLCGMSYWYNQTVGGSDDKITECFKAVLETKSSDLEYMVEGLRELAIGLLNADIHQSKYPNTLAKSRQLGAYLIKSIVKSCNDELPAVMKHLLKVSSRSNFHTECLAECLQMRTRQIIHPSIIGRTCEIIRHLPMMDSDSATLIVKALSNAFHLNYMLLDQLMLNLRKTIWKSVEARRTAARIMIILLSNSKVVGDIPFSQYSESQRMQDSQGQALSFGQIPDQQPLCIEILMLTKRCFNQQCEIREELYLGFYSVVRKNPGLCELICSQLFNHSNQYLSEESSDEKQILLNKVVDLSVEGSVNPVLIKEQLGFLVQCLSFVVTQSHHVFRSIEDGPPAAVDQLEQLIKRWTDCIFQITPDSIAVAAAHIVEEAGGSRPLDTVRYIETVFVIQLMQVIEALIEFLFTQNLKKNDRKVKKLFEKFKLLEPLLRREKERAVNKKGKKDKTKGNAKNDKTNKDSSNDDISILDNASDTTDGNPTVKLKKLEAPKRLVYQHIMNLESVLTMLQSLYGSEQDKGTLTLVHKENREFESFLLAIVKQKFVSFKRKEPLHERSRHPDKVVRTFSGIARYKHFLQGLQVVVYNNRHRAGKMKPQPHTGLHLVCSIWNGILANPSINTQAQDVDVVDESAAAAPITFEVMELRLETINDITSFLCSSHPLECCHLIKSFSDEVREDVSYDEVFPKLFNSWKTALGWIRVDSEKEKIVHQHLFEILQSFATQLSPDSQTQSQSSQVLNWMWGYMYSASSKGYNAEFSLADSVMSCWLAFYMKGKGVLEQPGQSQHDILSVARAVRAQMGDIEELQSTGAEPPKDKLWIVNDDTSSTIFCIILNYIETLLGHITAILGKLKSLQTSDDSMINQAADLREKCFIMINQILGVASELVTSAFPAGLCSTTVLKVVPMIFTIMSGFGEYFMELSKTKADFSIKGFSVPVSRIGKEFKVLVEGMIQHIERVQRLHAEEITKNTKTTKTSAKVPNAVKAQLMKDKKLIPNMVYSIEKYDQQIIALSNKKKDQKGTRLLVGMKLSTARDFKIDGGKLAEALRDRRVVQEISTVPDEETRMNPENAPGPAPGSRLRKGRKRKPATDENDEEGEA